jgi:hypothetical protein
MTLLQAAQRLHALRACLGDAAHNRLVLRPRPRHPPTLAQVLLGARGPYESLLEPQPSLDLPDDLLAPGAALVLDPAAAVLLPRDGHPQAWTLGPGPAACLPDEQPFALLLAHLDRAPDRPTSPLPWPSGEDVPGGSAHDRLAVARLRATLPRIPGLRAAWPDEVRLLLPFEGGIVLLARRAQAAWTILGLHVR